MAQASSLWVLVIARITPTGWKPAPLEPPFNIKGREAVRNLGFGSRQIEAGNTLSQRAEQIGAGGIGDPRYIGDGLRGAASVP